MHIVPLGVALIIGGAALIAILVRRRRRRSKRQLKSFTEPILPTTSLARGERLYELLRGKLTPRFYGYDDDNG